MTISFPINILRMNKQNLTNFCVHIHIDKIYVGIVTRGFCKFVTEMINVSILFLHSNVRINGQNLNKVCMHIYIEEI